MPECLFCGGLLYPVQDKYRGCEADIHCIHTIMKCARCSNLFLVKETFVLKTREIKQIKVED